MSTLGLIFVVAFPALTLGLSLGFCFGRSSVRTEREAFYRGGWQAGRRSLLEERA